MTTTFTDAIATDLDPDERFELRTGLTVNRQALLAVFAFLDMHGIDDVSLPGQRPAAGDWATQVLLMLDPGQVEEEALDRAPPGAGKYSTTRAVIAVCIEALQGAAGGGS